MRQSACAKPLQGNHRDHPREPTEKVEEPYNPESPFIPELQHRCPRNTKAWNTIHEVLRDGQKHTWADLITVGHKASGIPDKRVAAILRDAVKYGYIGSTYANQSRHTKAARYENRKAWLS